MIISLNVGSPIACVHCYIGCIDRYSLYTLLASVAGTHWFYYTLQYVEYILTVKQ